MKTSELYNKWIETAYALFAEEGPENLSIKALAKQCGLPLTNFYYYFDNKEELEVPHLTGRRVKLQKASTYTYFV